MSSSSGPDIITSGLILSLDAANRKSYPGSGTTWFDRSGNGNNGILTNGPTFSSSNGGLIALDGVNDSVSSINNTQITGSSARTLSVWFYPTESVLNRTYSVAKIGTGAGDRILFEILIGNNYVSPHFYGNGFSFSVNSDKILLNNFTNCVLTYLNPTVYCYIDGILKGTMNLVLNTTNSKLDIGVVGYSAFFPFKGLVANTLLYNRALSAQEILQNFNATKSRFGL